MVSDIMSNPNHIDRVWVVMMHVVTGSTSATLLAIVETEQLNSVQTLTQHSIITLCQQMNNLNYQKFFYLSLMFTDVQNFQFEAAKFQYYQRGHAFLVLVDLNSLWNVNLLSLYLIRTLYSNYPGKQFTTHKLTCASIHDTIRTFWHSGFCFQDYILLVFLFSQRSRIIKHS
jgi:hypothetical protein